MVDQKKSFRKIFSTENARTKFWNGKLENGFFNPYNIPKKGEKGRKKEKWTGEKSSTINSIFSFPPLFLIHGFLLSSAVVSRREKNLFRIFLLFRFFQVYRADAVVAASLHLCSFMPIVEKVGGGEETLISIIFQPLRIFNVCSSIMR